MRQPIKIILSFLGFLLVLFYFPSMASAIFSVGWNATSTGTSWISPNLVNGILQMPRANYFIASSTSNASIFPYASSTALTVTGSTYLATVNGNVGIGTTGPGRILYVQKDQNADTVVAVGNNTNGTAAQAGFLAGLNGEAQYVSLSIRPSSFTTNGLLAANSADLFSSANTALNIFTLSTNDLTLGTNNAANVTIQNGGNVGIGTTTPLEKLDVYGNIKLSANGLASINSRNIDFNNYITSDPATRLTMGDSNGDGANGYFTFSTKIGGVFGERVRISSTGNVGIGTTTPTSLLQVSGATPKFYLSNTSGAVDGKHWFLSNSSGDFSIGTTSDSLATNSTFLTVKGSTGNVGIGTTSPAYKLDVYGNLRVDGVLSLTDLATPAGTFLAIDGSGQIIATSTPASGATASDSTWTLHNDFPAACGAGDFVTAIGDTLTCGTPVGGSGGSNWTIPTHYGVPMVASTTPVWAAGGLYASSTSAALTVQNTTDAVANQVAIFSAGNRATPADNDQGYLSFYGNSDTAGQQEFGRILWEMDDVTDTTKDSTLRFYNQINNVLTDGMDLVGKNLTVNGSLTVSTGITSSVGLASGGFSIRDGGGATYFYNQTTAENLVGNNLRGSTNTNISQLINRSQSVLSANVSSANLLFKGSIVEATSGNHPLLSQLAIQSFITTAGNATVSDTASLYIEGAATTTVVSGKNYSLWVDDIGGGGVTLIDGNVILATSTGSSVGIGTSTPGGGAKLAIQGTALADDWLTYSPFSDKANATQEIKGIKCELGTSKNGWCDIDHTSLPQGVRVQLPYKVPDILGYKNMSADLWDEELQATTTKSWQDPIMGEKELIGDYMSTTKLTAMLVQSIQELDVRVSALENENLQQQAEIIALKMRINKIDNLGIEPVIVDNEGNLISTELWLGFGIVLTGILGVWIGKRKIKQ